MAGDTGRETGPYKSKYAEFTLARQFDIGVEGKVL